MYIAFKECNETLYWLDLLHDTEYLTDSEYVSIHMDCMEQALQAVEKLAKGGEVISPLKPHPAPDDGGCGSVTKDRFGYTWIITCPNPDKQ